MHFYGNFFMNISILITSSYLLNLIYKYMFQKASERLKQIGMIATFIFTGWLAMKFGTRVGESSIFDLRNVPIVVASVVLKNPVQVLLIGLGIAASRYGVNGISIQAVTGSINITTLGLVAAGLVTFYQRYSHWCYRSKAILSLLLINIVQVSGIAAYGAVNQQLYLTHIMPYTLPLAVLLGAFFLFIIRDFHLDQLHVEALHRMNQTLTMQKQELETAKQQLEEKANQILQASRYKSEFMANMSHELKTPLNSIILLAQMIHENEENQYPNEDVQYANFIHSSGNQLLQMINDILDLSQVEAGKMDFVWGTLPVEDSMQLLYDQFHPLSEQKGLKMELKIDADVPRTLETDGLRLSQILRYLLLNAIKFTEKGSIILQLSMDPHKETGEEAVLFRIIDTGVGIEADKQQLIFEAFQQGDGATNRKYGGTGLGLSISLQLAMLLGGALSLSSAKGVGSEFVLRLPVRPPVGAFAIA